MAKLAGAGALALFALQALPHLLRPPEPPPLAADVGLPRVISAAEPSGSGPHRPPLPEPRIKRSPVRSGVGPAEVVIASEPRPKRHRRPRAVAVPAPPAPPVAATAEPPPAPTPVPPPPPAPGPSAPPSDGSEEFAPH